MDTVSDQVPPVPPGPEQRPDASQPPQYPGAVPPPPQAGMGAYPPPAPAYGPRVDRRPGTVTAAAVTAIVLAALGTVFWGLTGMFAVVAQDEFVDELHNAAGFEGYSRSELTDLAGVVGILCVCIAAWSVFTVVTASLSLRRHNWARIVTIITSGGWAFFGVFSVVIGVPVGIVAIGLGVTVVVLYLVGQANAWYNGTNA